MIRLVLILIASTILAVASNYLYDIGRSRGLFPTKPSVQQWARISAFFLSLIIFIVILQLVDTNKKSVPDDNLDHPSIVIGERGTKVFADGAIFVTVTDIDDSLDYISFMVSSPGYPSQSFSNIEVGFSIVYEGDRKYQVHVLRIGWGGLFDPTRVAEISVAAR